MKRPGRNQFVVGTQPRRYQRNAQPSGRHPEWLFAVSLIVAAMLATFLALFLTSRPYDPMNSTIAPQPDIPLGPNVLQPSPKQSPSPTPSPQPNQKSSPEQSPEPGGETTKQAIPDDATIQAQIEKVIAADTTLSKLDISTIVEAGKVTIVGSVRSADLKQRVEKAVRSVKGVAAINNQVVVVEVTPQ